MERKIVTLSPLLVFSVDRTPSASAKPKLHIQYVTGDHTLNYFCQIFLWAESIKDNYFISGLGN